MSYPYLPVNSCCTDVVLNSPCGCSSTITNSSCNNNSPCSTNLTASSTIVYDGPVLSCTSAEPCDTLNVILQKIDQIICNLLSQINVLSNQVSNINTQIITINNDIININNQLDICCATTTTSTTIIPTTTTSSSTSTSTTSTTTIAPTTTTTTTIAPTTTTTTTAMMVLQLFGCCDSTIQYVAYNPALTSLPAVFTATNGLPYQVVSATPIAGVPTRVISDFTNYNDCSTWHAFFGGCP